MNYSAIAMIVVVGLLVYYELLAHKRKIRNLEDRINQLAKLTGYDNLSSFLVSDELKEQAIQLKRDGNTVKAVKIIRETTKMDLLGAKQYVDTLE